MQSNSEATSPTSPNDTTTKPDEISETRREAMKEVELYSLYECKKVVCKELQKSIMNNNGVGHPMIEARLAVIVERIKRLEQKRSDIYLRPMTLRPQFDEE
jgi:hypothetical protein